MDVGVFPSQMLSVAFLEGVWSSSADLDPDQIQPASVDLRCGLRVWKVKASFLPGRRSVRERLERFATESFVLTGGVVLERDCVYIVELMESLNLPSDVQVVCNAKSSTGRLDILARVLGDGCQEFDTLPAGYKGRLYLEICPRSFPVVLYRGQRLVQMRFAKGLRLPLDDKALRQEHGLHNLVVGQAVISNGLGFSVDLDRGPLPVGYRARLDTMPVDLSRVNFHRVDDFWDPVCAEDGEIVLEPGAFYILASREALHIPPHLCAEMAPYWPLAGEFRVHYAGFFDPGFGHAPAGGANSKGVLEVRCHEVPFVLEHGQTVGRLVFERMLCVPDRLYGVQSSSNYQGQALKLSKHFSASAL